MQKVNICPTNLKLKFETGPMILGNFFPLVEIFTVLPVKFSTNCFKGGKTVKRNQSLANVCFDVSSKHCAAVTQRRETMTRISRLPLARFFCTTNHLKRTTKFCNCKC